MSTLLVRSHPAGIRELILNRPAQKNALTLAMYRALTDALSEAAADDEVRVVLLRGAGDSFCAGNDLADFIAAGQAPDALQPIVDFLHTLVDFPRPLIAAVQGHAVGIGTTLWLHCDQVLVADDLQAQLPFARLGLVPEGGASLLLPMRLGHQPAFELLVEGAPIDAARAVQLGLAAECCAAEQLSQRALERASRLAALPVQAVQQSKALLKAPWQAQLHRVIDEEAQQFAAQLARDDTRARLQVALGGSRQD